MKRIFRDFSEITVGGEPITHIAWCIAIIVFALLLKKPLANWLTLLVGTVANRFCDRKYGVTFKELLQRPLELLLTTILFYVALNQLTVLLNIGIFSRVNEAGRARYAIHLIDAIDKVFLLFTIVFVTLVISRIADFIFHILIDRAFEADNREREQLLPLVKEVAKILLWAIGIFWVLGSVFSVNIPALITGLGIGGVAIALAAKESVENFFASFTILTDKPFRTGDSIRLGNFEGKVEKVGFRSTRLRSAGGSMYIIPNKNLIGDNLENQTERSSRQMKLAINLPYGVPYENVEKIIAAVKELLKQDDLVYDNFEVTLEAFNEAAFMINVIYNLPDPLPAGRTLAEVKQGINMKIYQRLDGYLPTGIQKYEVVNTSPKEDA